MRELAEFGGLLVSVLVMFWRLAWWMAKIDTRLDDMVEKLGIQDTRIGKVEDRQVNQWVNHSRNDHRGAV